MPNSLLIRADANANIGIGHVMRCVALAQAWQDGGGRVVFALARGGEEIHERLRAERCEVLSIASDAGSAEDADETSALCKSVDTDWVVLDGYHFSREYRHRLCAAPASVLVIDDHGAFAPYDGDVVVNANVYASEQMYSGGRGEVRFLLGSKYALLRREFLRVPPKREGEPETATRVLVTLGGADPENVTSLVVESLRELADLPVELTVVLGASNRHRESIERALKEFPRLTRLLANVTNMPELMAQSDLAISAGGGTCDELAFLRVPMFLITIADNQVEAVKAYARKRAAVTAGWFKVLTKAGLAEDLRGLICDRRLRSEIAENAGQLVDGHGAQRVVAAMRSVAAAR